MTVNSFDAPLGSRTSFDSTAPDQKPDLTQPLDIELEPEEGAEPQDAGSAPSQPEQFNDNLIDRLPSEVVARIIGDLDHDVDNDLRSRRDWEDAYTEGLKLLGLKYEKRSEPWTDACGVFHPLLTEAVVRFQSETIIETFPAKGPVRTIIIGEDTPEKKDAAKRVEEDMNYKLTEQMTEYRPEHERLLWALPIAGSAFKKVYFDPALGRQTSVFVPAEDVILPYGTSEITTTAERITHQMRKTKLEVERLQAQGFYSKDADLGEPLQGRYDKITEKKDQQTGQSGVFDERFTLREVQVYLDIKELKDSKDPFGAETDLPLPYIVTYDKDSLTGLAIRRNWDPQDSKLKRPRTHFVHYIYIPGFGAYGFGLVHLIGGYARAATFITRQLVDAGTLSNLPGGLKTKGLRIKGDDTPIAPGEFRDVDVFSGVLKDNIMPLPYKEPSATLLNLLQQMVQEGKQFASTADMKVSDMSAQAPVGTTLAIIERMLKVMSAVQARVHFSLKQELKLLKGIIQENTPAQYDIAMDQKTGTKAKKQDYAHVDVIPCSDPNASTTTQRIAQYQVAMQLSQGQPQIYNMPLLHQSMLYNIGMNNADKLVPMPDQQTVQDPVTENQNLMKGVPVKAFPTQNHEAHIQIHMAAMQDPKIAALIGQSPNAQAIQGAMQAHLQDHLGWAYRVQMEQQLGHALPPPDQPMDPKVEAQLSIPIAQAAQRLLQSNQSQAAQEQAAQNAMDPVLQLQQQDQQLKAQELQRKENKDLADTLVKVLGMIMQRETREKDDFAKGTEMGLKHMETHQARDADMHKTGFGHGIELHKAAEQRQHDVLHPKPAPSGMPPKGNGK